MAGWKHRRFWGLAAGMSVSLTTIIVVGVIAARSALETPPLPIAGGAEELPDVRAGARGGDGLFVQFVDPEDPTRVTGEMEARSVDPDPAGPRRFIMDQPVVRLFPDDATTVHVRADTGRFFAPSRDQEPESGTLEGDVVVRVYDTSPEPLRRTGGGDAPPAVELRTPRLEFDTTIGQVRTDDGWVLSGTAARGEGRHLLARFDEVNQRLAWLETEGAPADGGRAWLAFNLDSEKKNQEGGAPEDEPVTDQPPGRVAQAASDPPTPSGTGSASGPAGASAPTPGSPEPIETTYEVTFERDVRVERGAMWITADHLRILARLIDNELPDGAIGGMETAARDPAPAPEVLFPPLSVAGAMPKWWLLPPFELDEAPPVPARAEGDDPKAGSMEGMDAEDWVTIHYAGRMLVMALPSAPPELASDHVAVRFRSDPGGVVRFSDSDLGGRGHMAEVHYRATTRQVLLASSEGVPRGRLVLDEAGAATFERCEFDWENGLAHLTGPGFAEGREGEQQIRWREQADLVFRMENGRMARDLQQARFVGDVLASKEESLMRGGFMRVDFERTEEGRSLPSHLFLQRGEDGPARAQKNPEEFIEGDTIDAVLVPGPDAGQVDPSSVTLIGNVRGVQRDAELRAGELETRLERNSEGDLVATDALASGGCTFVRAEDDVRAEAETIYARPEAETAHLLGENAMIAMRTTRVYGRELELDGKRQAIEVAGPGLFDDARGSGAVATWTSSMRYDDASGALECEGGVSAFLSPDPWSRDWLTGERLQARLGMTDGTGENSPRAALGGFAQAADDRQIEWALLEGSSPEDPEGRPARVESVRFAIPAELDVDGGGAASGGRQASAGGAEADGSALPPAASHQWEEGTASVGGIARLPEDPAALVGFLTGAEGARAGGVDRMRVEAEPIRTSMLEGGIIEYDNVAQTLHVPTSGELLHADLTSEDDEGEGGGLSGRLSGGQVHFRFRDSLHADWKQGVVDLHGDVKVTHRRRDSDGEGVVTLLDAEHVRARFDPTEAGGSGELRSARATGEVYAATRRGPVLTQEVIADGMDYDLEEGTAEAWAEEGVVRFFDATRAAPASARRVFWDMKRGRMEVLESGPIVSPR